MLTASPNTSDLLPHSGAKSTALEKYRETLTNVGFLVVENVVFSLAEIQSILVKGDRSVLAHKLEQLLENNHFLYFRSNAEDDAHGSGKNLSVPLFIGSRPGIEVLADTLRRVHNSASPGISVLVNPLIGTTHYTADLTQVFGPRVSGWGFSNSSSGSYLRVTPGLAARHILAGSGIRLTPNFCDMQNLLKSYSEAYEPVTVEAEYLDPKTGRNIVIHSAEQELSALANLVPPEKIFQSIFSKMADLEKRAGTPLYLEFAINYNTTTHSWDVVIVQIAPVTLKSFPFESVLPEGSLLIENNASSIIGSGKKSGRDVLFITQNLFLDFTQLAEYNAQHKDGYLISISSTALSQIGTRNSHAEFLDAVSNATAIIDDASSNHLDREFFGPCTANIFEAHLGGRIRELGMLCAVMRHPELTRFIAGSEDGIFSLEIPWQVQSSESPARFQLAISQKLASHPSKL